ncbi:MAG: PDZ domain-containing protein [Actinobacteria bacterium]|nr:PDZ domain-containing protein [Actinomycetota bacterium]
MTVDVRLQALRTAVTELIAFESDLEARLEGEREVVRAYPEGLATLERFRPTVHAQRERLASYLEGIGGAEAGAATQGGLPFIPAAGVSAALRGVCVAFNHGAISYAMLYEMALRLYEPALREIAPEHVEVYVDAASTLYRLLPAAVAWELAQDGLQCSCICPMCGLGVCGCVSFGTQTLVETWREALAAESELPGFALQPPKPESELARAGVRGGDRLLAVDGQEVRSVRDIQVAIRKHALGEEVRLLVQRGSQPAGEIGVRHVSDYPEA